MTKTARIINILFGLCMLVMAGLIIMYPQLSTPFILGVIGLGMTVKGIRSLFYYFSMAKHMVGGKRVLYRGIIFLDVGVLTSTLADSPELTVIIYIAVLSAFTGLLAVLKARESMKLGSPHWKGSMLYGVLNILVAATVIYFGSVDYQPHIATLMFAAGLIYSAILKIASAFRKTAIVYIQ